MAVCEPRGGGERGQQSRPRRLAEVRTGRAALLTAQRWHSRDCRVPFYACVLHRMSHQSDARRVSAPNPLFLKRHSSRLDSGGDLVARTSIASDEGVTVDDVRLAGASDPRSTRSTCATPVVRIAAAFAVAVLLAAGVAAAILVASTTSSVTVPEVCVARHACYWAVASAVQTTQPSYALPLPPFTPDVPRL